MKQKMSFLAANTQDGFGAHRDKKYPMCTMKYTAVFLMLWAYISAGLVFGDEFLAHGLRLQSHQRC